MRLTAHVPRPLAAPQAPMPITMHLLPIGPAFLEQALAHGSAPSGADADGPLRVTLIQVGVGLMSAPQLHPHASHALHP